MSDIVERLKWLHRDLKEEGGRLDHDSFSVIDTAIAEIERLRAMIENLRQIAGAAWIELPLMTFADIKKEAKK